MKRRRERAAGQTADLSCGAAAETATTTHVPAGAVVPVDDEDLLVVEEEDDSARQAAEALQRRLGDLALVDKLTHAGFSGPAWRRFAHELARYGHAVMMAWMWTGEIFAQRKARGCPLAPAPSAWDYEDRMNLANDTVTDAIRKFRATLVEGKWSVTGGASLKTYFVGACVYAFGNPYRKWCNEEDRQRRQRQDALALSFTAPTESADPAALALTAFQLRSVFDDIHDQKTKTAVLLKAMGYTHQEIGELLDKTPGAVREMLRRQRLRAPRIAQQGGSDD